MGNAPAGSNAVKKVVSASQQSVRVGALKKKKGVSAENAQSIPRWVLKTDIIAQGVLKKNNLGFNLNKREILPQIILFYGLYKWPDLDARSVIGFTTKKKRV